MLETLPAVPWSTFPQPPWNRPDTIPIALRRLATLDDVKHRNDVYNDVLYALGNNHCGTIWPVATAVIPFLVDIIEHGAPLAASSAVDVLYEVLLFYPDEGFDTIPGPDGSAVPLRDAVLREVSTFRPRLEVIKHAPGTQLALVGQIADLLDHLDDRADPKETP